MRKVLSHTILTKKKSFLMQKLCLSLKGTSYLSGSRLLAASGLHHLMGNHWHILVRSILVIGPYRTQERYRAILLTNDSKRRCVSIWTHIAPWSRYASYVATRQYISLISTIMKERSMRYEKILREKSRIIRQTEMENMNLGRKKNRSELGSSDLTRRTSFD